MKEGARTPRKVDVQKRGMEMLTWGQMMLTIQWGGKGAMRRIMR